jgi:hypothetical protein
MSNTVLLILAAILLVVGIFWLVGYSGRRRHKYREKTSIKPQQSPKESGVTDS